MSIVEKEIKVKVNDFPKLIKFLLDNGGVVLNKSKEKTIRFDKSNHELENNGIFLRVRSGSKNTITMKEKIGYDKDVRARKETEFEIEDVNQMAYILEKLGFDYSKTMEKYRINLNYKGAKLSIDELPFGIFLEIEGEEKQISSIAAELGYKDEDKILVTYWDLFEEYKKNTGTAGKDIIFPRDHKSQIFQL